MSNRSGRPWQAWTAIFGMTSLFIFFQNCGQAPGPSTEVASEEEVRIVDDWNQQKLIFATSLLEIEGDEDEALVEGLCDRKSLSAPLNWILIDAEPTSEQAWEGEVLCERGGFRIALDHLNSLQCDLEFRLLAQSQSGERALLFLKRKCS